MTKFRNADELRWEKAKEFVSPETIAQYRKELLAARTPDGWEAIAGVYRSIIDAVGRQGSPHLYRELRARGFPLIHGYEDLGTALDAIEVNRLAQHDG